MVDWLRGHWGGRPHIFTDCRENLPPVPEWNTDFPEVLICEMAENGNVNLVLGKALSVLPETEPFEPVRNLLHRRPSTDLTLSVLDRHVVAARQDRIPWARVGAPISNKARSGVVHGSGRRKARQCPLWVKSRHMRCNRPCPLYPQ